MKAAINRDPVIKPVRPVPGDTLGIVAPASPFDRNKFQAGVQVLEDMGFQVVWAKDIFEKKGYLAGSDVHRARAFHAMFADPEIKGVICARGGYGALRILPLIDFDGVAADPKLLIGCSDITVLLNSLVYTCHLPTLHGPMIESLASASMATKQAFSLMLSSPTPPALTAATPRVIRPGKAAGTLVGGNLTTLCHLAGTRFAPDFSGCIVLLEDVGEQPYRLDRMLTQMKMGGGFDQAAGLVLGSFKNCGTLDAVHAIFTDIFAGSPFPVMAGFDVGHDDPNVSVPLGIRADLDTEQGLLEFTESLFC